MDEKDIIHYDENHVIQPDHFKKATHVVGISEKGAKGSKKSGRVITIQEMESDKFKTTIAKNGTTRSNPKYFVMKGSKEECEEFLGRKQSGNPL